MSAQLGITAFAPDTPGRLAYRKARNEALCAAALTMRNRGPAVLVDGEWQYGWTLAECFAAVLVIVEGKPKAPDD